MIISIIYMQKNLSKSIEFFYNNIIDTSLDGSSDPQIDANTIMHEHTKAQRRRHRCSTREIGKLATTDSTRATPHY
jgi:hypothetical protein